MAHACRPARAIRNKKLSARRRGGGGAGPLHLPGAVCCVLSGSELTQQRPEVGDPTANKVDG